MFIHAHNGLILPDMARFIFRVRSAEHLVIFNIHADDMNVELLQEGMSLLNLVA
jgi:hypothetical protein